MTLRKKTLLIISLTLVGLMVVLYVTYSTILLSSFAELEEQDTCRNVERVLAALSDDLSALNSEVGDWAAWDETYHFIEDASDSYIKRNLPDATFVELRLNLVLFIHSSGRMVFGRAFDLENEKAIPFPKSLKEHLSASSPLLRHLNIESSLTGIIFLPEGPLLIASRPILTTERKGPIRGTLIFGRNLDATEIKRLALITHLFLIAHRLDDAQMPLDFQTARSFLSEKAPIFVRPLSVDSIAGYTMLRDIYEKPGLILRVSIPRAIYKQGQASVRYFIFSLLAAGLVFCAATLLPLEKLVLSRLARLSTDVGRIGRSSDLSARLATAGRDELSSLAGEINNMLEALKYSQHELQRARDELEIRVQERTAELAKANEALQAEIIEYERVEEELKRLRRQNELILNSAGEGIFGLDLQGRYTFVNPAAARMLGYEVAELVGRHSHTTSHHTKKDGTPYPEEECPIYSAYKDGSIHHMTDEIFWKKDGTSFPVEYVSTPIIEHGELIGAVVTFKDITGHKEAEEQIQLQLHRLGALHEIDMAISASLDLRVTLNVLLDKVITQLGIHAADVLLFNPNTQMLEYAAGRGFRSRALQYTRLRLGEGYAGRAALERRIIIIPNLAEAGNGLKRSPLLASEGFVSYYSVPLISKGQIKGMLEIFHRVLLSSNPEWLEFLETLATQAAIAIDNAEMFNSLQRSNIELTMAYDATLEGWSRALDMRDKETEGHSQRVTEMTLRLAQAMNMSGSELVHVRRGALLHDIGKIGIPDRILLKPGPLSDEEWEIMRKHPVYAYELLSPISYLRPALDIPYCHHEKWDGTGYPRGLKGEQIPLAARIFAVVDVWESLLSSRPYRPAWPKEKVIEYIRSLPGTHFDPEVVEVFFKME